MAANPSIQLGTDGNWAIKEDNLLAYKKDGTRFFNKEFDFTRNTTATFVDQNGLIQESDTNTPRIDFTDDATGHLLLEPQSTNLIPYSEDFSDWTTTGTANVTPNTSISPDGTRNASTLNIVDSTYFYKSISTGSGTFTLSCYVKVSSGTNDFKMQSFSGTDGANVSSVFTATTEWQRFEHTVTVTVDSNFYPVFISSPLTGGKFQIWGAQVEQLSYATSYIPTNGSTATRNAEICDNSGSAQDFNDSEGVLYAEIAALANDGTGRRISLNDGTTNNTVEVRYTSNNNQIQLVIRDNGTATVNPSINISNVLEFNKIALSYKADDCKMYINGVRERTDTNCTMPSGLNRLSFNWGGSNPFYGKTKDLKVFKRAMSDGELYLLTVPQYQSYQEMATALNYTL